MQTFYAGLNSRQTNTKWSNSIPAETTKFSPEGGGRDTCRSERTRRYRRSRKYRIIICLSNKVIHRKCKARDDSHVIKEGGRGRGGRGVGVDRQITPAHLHATRPKKLVRSKLAGDETALPHEVQRLAARINQRCYKS